MKKLFLLSLVLTSILLASCAPAQAPTAATEPAATEYPVTATPAFTSTPQQQDRGTIMVQINYPGIPDALLDKEKGNSENIDFQRQGDNIWSIGVVHPTGIKNLGPLFRYTMTESLSSLKGSCGVNTLDTNEFNGDTNIQPICNTIGENEILSIGFGLKNCHVDEIGGLICEQSTDTGTLRSAFNKNMDKFQFNFDGSYNYNYEPWIRVALNGLGFDQIPDNFFDNVVAGQRYFIYKHAPAQETK